MTAPAGPGAAGLSEVCHDLRRPLTVIRGAATLLVDSHDQLPPESRSRLLGLIDQRARAMSDLIEDLVIVSRLESGEMEVTTGPVQVRELVSAAVEAVGEPYTGVQPSQIDPVELEVEADPEQAVRVLRVLLSQALEGSEDRAPEVSAQAAGGKAAILLPLGGTNPGAGGHRLYLARGLARLMAGDVAVVELPGGDFAYSFTLNRRV